MPEFTPKSAADLLALHRQELDRFIHRKLGSPEAACDILQDAYLRLIQSRPKEALNHPRSFLYRIVSNLVIDHIRRAPNRFVHASDEELLNSISDRSADPESRCASAQRLEFLAAVMDELPEKCRQAFYLNRVEGLTYAEIGRRLKLSESMVAKYLARAMRHCRERLGEPN